MADNPYRCQSGMILAATIWGLAVIMVLVSYYALWLANAREELNARLSLFPEQDLFNTRSTLLYLLASQPMTLAGLTVVDKFSQEENDRRHKIAYGYRIEDMGEPWEGAMLLPQGDEIALDGRTYQGLGAVQFAIQDEQGLFTVNTGNLFSYQRLLRQMNIPAKMQEGLLDKLQDWMDMDNYHRNQGAEQRHYLDQGLRPPTNRLLRTPHELQSILGWNQYPLMLRSAEWNRLTTSQLSAAYPNINTAPAEVLQVYEDIDNDAANQLITARNKQVFTQHSQLTALLGNKKWIPDELSEEFIPNIHFGGTVRIYLWLENQESAEQMQINAVSLGDTKSPLRMMQSFKVEYPSRFKTQSYKVQSPLF